MQTILVIPMNLFRFLCCKKYQNHLALDKLVHQKWTYSFVVSKHAQAVWIKRIMLIVEKANEREKSPCFHSLKFLFLAWQILAGTELFSFSTNWFWLLGTLCLLTDDIKISTGTKTTKDVRENVKEKQMLLYVDLFCSILSITTTTQ